MNDPLNENVNYVDPSSVSPMSTAVRYGLIWSLVGVLLGLCMHVLGWNDPANPNVIASMVVWLIVTSLAFVMTGMAIKHYRDQELGGFITFGNAFKVALFAAFISALIAVVWILIYRNLIAPDMFVNMEDALIEQWEAQGMSEEQIEQALSWTGFMTGPTGMLISTFFTRVIWGSIAGLIMAAIMKKDPPRMA